MYYVSGTIRCHEAIASARSKGCGPELEADLLAGNRSVHLRNDRFLLTIVDQCIFRVSRAEITANISQTVSSQGSLGSKALSRDVDSAASDPFS